MDEQRRERLSKLLSLLLRHKPYLYDIKLDAQGYAALADIVEAAQQKFDRVTEEEILYIVNESEKRRFEMKNGRVRARYGHSFPIDLGLDPVDPPEYLYYATAPEQMRDILTNGLRPAERQYVHLSLTGEIASDVAKRRTDKPVVFRIHAKKAAGAGVVFYDRAPVVLTTGVPCEFIEVEPSSSSAVGVLYGRRKRLRVR